MTRIKILTIIGARPQIIKAAALSRAIRNYFSTQIEEIIVHTGQHYDENMSNVFFEEMQIPKPNYNLEVGSGSHGSQTAKMIEKIEEVLLKEKPDFTVLYGDTNSTLAGAIASSKIHIPVAHIEAGLRSFNKNMPEEINRIMCDHVSTLLFSPTKAGLKNLVQEGFNPNNEAPYSYNNPKIYHCGDIMYDNSLYFAEIANEKNYIDQFEVTAGEFILATIHRDNNTDIPERINAIFKALLDLSNQKNLKIILPLHPRTAKMLPLNLEPSILEELNKNHNFRIIPPASYLEMVALEQNAKLIITDSGGVQKEAFFYKKPCIILRPETEWVELVESGSAIIADADYDRIIAAYDNLNKLTQLNFPTIFGDGKSAEFICQEIINCAHKA